jgi:hypothetical protein
MDGMVTKSVFTLVDLQKYFLTAAGLTASKLVLFTKSDPANQIAGNFSNTAASKFSSLQLPIWIPLIHTSKCFLSTALMVLL